MRRRGAATWPAGEAGFDPNPPRNVQLRDHGVGEYAIPELADYDVVCGRGSGTNCLPGNAQLRNAVAWNLQRYLMAPQRRDKKRIVQLVVEGVRQRGGRFLQPHPSNSALYRELTMDSAMAKAAQIFRDTWKKAQSRQQGSGRHVFEVASYRL